MSDKSSEIGHRCMFQLVKQTLIQIYFKKSLSWHLMPIQVLLQEDLRGGSS